MSRLNFIHEELEKLEEEGHFVNIRTIEGPQDAWITADGKKVLNLCSNNYLGFANSPRLKSAAKGAIDAYGVGPSAVRTISGTTVLHCELERKLALFKGAESTISFQSGFCANLAVIPTIAGKNDVIFSDELNHASIIDGCRLSRAKIIRYEHCNPDDLRGKISQERNAERRLIITDGVFSMEGDIAPLPEIVKIADEFNAITMVDDAHGEGVLGKGGRGIVDYFNLQGKVDIEVGTLSKAFGVVGGYVAGSKKLTDYLSQKGRPFLFSSAATSPGVAACIAAVDILMESKVRVEKLWTNTALFQKQMKNTGFDIGRTQTPITPIMVGDAKLAKEFSRKLYEEGIFIQSIGYPTVPVGKARLRAMLSAAHSENDLLWAVGCFEKIGKILGISN